VHSSRPLAEFPDVIMPSLLDTTTIFFDQARLEVALLLLTCNSRYVGAEMKFM
jgi:hypothetical protein